MEDEKQESFFKKVIISIKDFEKYPILACKNWKVVLAYLLKLLAMFSIVVLIAFIFTTLKQIETIEKSEEIVSINTITAENAGQVVKNLIDKISQEYSQTNQVFIYAIILVITFLYIYIIYIVSTLLDALLLGSFGYFTAIILRMHIKFSAMFKIAIHSLTLPIILKAIYVLIKTFSEFEIKYFDIMYVAISYIYIITAVLMIKSDFIKNQKELTRILQEQEKVRQELERQKKEEEKQKEQKDKNEQKRKEDKKEKEENKDDKEEGLENDNNEPQGDNA